MGNKIEICPLCGEEAEQVYYNRIGKETYALVKCKACKKRRTLY